MCTIFMFLCCFLVLFAISARGVDVQTSAGWDFNHLGKSVLGVEYSLNQQYFWKINSENNIHIDAHLTWFEVLNGKVIHLDQSVLSNLCPLQICGHCGGKGVAKMSSFSSNETYDTFTSEIHFPCPFCFGSGRTGHRSSCFFTSDSHIDVVIPPGSAPGQEFIYKPFSEQEDGGMFGTIIVSIKEFISPSSTPIVYNEKKKGFVLLRNITAQMGVLGFSEMVEMGEGCLPLRIDRKNKVTLTEMTISVPFSYLQEYHCPSIVFDNSNPEKNTFSPIDFSANGSHALHLEVVFHILSMEERELNFLQSWRCHIEKKKITEGYVQAALQTDPGLIVPTFLSNTYESEDEEIICSDESSPDYFEQREKAFRQFRQKSFTYRKFWNWLTYLKEVTK